MRRKSHRVCAYRDVMKEAGGGKVVDKLAQIAMFTYLGLWGAPPFWVTPLWFIAVLIVRDAVLLLGYLLIRRRHGKVINEHELHGKLSSVLLFAVLVWVHLGEARLAL